MGSWQVKSELISQARLASELPASLRSSCYHRARTGLQPRTIYKSLDTQSYTSQAESLSYLCSLSVSGNSSYTFFCESCSGMDKRHGLKVYSTFFFTLSITCLASSTQNLGMLLRNHHSGLPSEFVQALAKVHQPELISARDDRQAL